MNEPVNLAKLTYASSGGRLLTLQELIEHWDLHVSRLNEDLTNHIDDDHAWGAHDFVAALYVRQRLQGGLDLASEVRAELLTRSANSDAVFRDLTEPDDEEVVSRFADEVARNDWWWRRLPKSGMPRRELDQWTLEHRSK